MAKNLNRRTVMAWAISMVCMPRLLAAPTSNKLIASKITVEQNRTRIVIESDENLRYRYFALQNPERFVLDIENSIPNDVLNKLLSQVQNKDAFIRNIRFGQKDAYNVRVVLDLKQAATAKVTTLAPSGKLKHRIQIELTANKMGVVNAPPPAIKTQYSDHNNKTHDPLNELIDQHMLSDEQLTPLFAQKKPATNAPIIMIDAGHGGKDPGASGASGIQEKSIVLSVALELKKHLEAQGYTVHLTRQDDRFLSLNSRRKMAHQVKANLFISLHANATENPTTRGTDVYIWGNANSDYVRKIVQSENAADRNLVDGMIQMENEEVAAILNDMIQTKTAADSTRLGNLILRQMLKYTKLHKNTIDTANFAVLRSLDIPSVLIELGFLSNPEDEALLKTKNFQRNAAHAITMAIQQYFSKS